MLASELEDLRTRIEELSFRRDFHWLVVGLSFFGVLPAIAAALFFVFDVSLVTAILGATLIPLVSLTRAVSSSREAKRLSRLARQARSELDALRGSAAD